MKALEIAVLGCGWLGLPLLRRLVADGHGLRGSSRSAARRAEITAAGGTAFPVDLPDKLPPGFLDGADWLVISLPPGGRTHGPAAAERYVAALAALKDWFASPANCRRTIFLSSTGVYGDATGVVDETTPHRATTHSGAALLAAACFFASLPARPFVLYLAGLVGPGRHPGTFYGGKDRPVPRADAPVNLLHQRDAIAAIRTVLTLGEPDNFNVCQAGHPPKGAFYGRAAAALGLSLAGCVSGGGGDKRISSKKLRARGWRPSWDDLDLDRM